MAISSSLSCCCLFKFPKLHPNVIAMLEEIYGLSPEDLAVLSLCVRDYKRHMLGLSDVQWRNNPARIASVQKLKQRGLIKFSVANRIWEANSTGIAFLRTMPIELQHYVPIPKATVQILEFPKPIGVNLRLTHQKRKTIL